MLLIECPRNWERPKILKIIEPELEYYAVD
ncbi:Uncharacterised protein [Legionella taurinensis]|nr:Uncharacterised protein [Legionella taurinensis]